MDELRSFYLEPGSKVVRLRGAQTCGRRLTKEDTTDNMSRKVEHRQSVLLKGTDYARETKDNEQQLHLKSASDRQKWESISGGLESLENVSLFESQQNLVELTKEAMTAVYSQYSFRKKEETTRLAINDYQQQILEHIHHQPVVIIEGPTGCGKTTQVPQWILDDCYAKRKHCKIIVTQPRRIAAISIAKRVAQERGWDVGGIVGYQVGLENQTSADSHITYATTGILLQKLVASKTLNEYTHIILDEVHERGQEMDFLLLVVRRLLFTVSQNVKVIHISATFSYAEFANYFQLLRCRSLNADYFQQMTLKEVILMSATFNYAEFANYFQQPTLNGLEPSICVRVERKQPMFNVKTFYLNQLQKFGNLIQSAMHGNDTPAIPPDMHKLVIKLVNAFEFIDKQEEHYTDASEADLPSVLVFLPGINEIEDLYGMLTSHAMRTKVAGAECAKYKWCVLPLHSTITADEQVRVFLRAPPGTRKIILSTNIAESSITVPDVKYVIDFCLMKILVADEQTNFTSLQLRWASKNNCEQRAGRAGRVREGRVYRLVTDKFYDQLSQECPPEICRCPLERLVLLAKTMEMGPPADILGLAMNPPDLSNIHRTILVLKETGAMKRTLEGEHSDIDGDITYLGRLMAKLPLDVRVSKLIMLGHIFGCLPETVIMAAAMSVKNLFNNPFMERLHAYNSKLTWANGSTSDCTAFLNVYEVWSHLRQQQFFKQRGNSEGVWAQRFYVQARALRELDELKRELERRLSRERIVQLKAPAPWSKDKKTLLLKILIAGAFYPHYFVLSAGKQELEREAVRTLGGLDPRTTVYLSDFPVNQPASVYASSIKKIVHDLTGDEPRVTFDNNSSKVFLSFKDCTSSSQKNTQEGCNPTIPGNVVLPVYKAVKLRHLSKPGAGRNPMAPGIRLALLPPEKAHELALELQASKLDINKNMMVPRLPEMDDTHFPLVISQFINCGRFWVQHRDDQTAADLRRLHAELNEQPLLAHTATAAPGELLAAPYRDESGTAMFRVRVMKLLPQDMVWVLYLDYGGFGRVNAGSLRALPGGLCQQLPPMAMQCVLAKVAPSPLLDTHGHWTREATATFQQLIKRGPLMGKVYSVVQGVVAIKLLADDGRLNVNKELIKRNYAHDCDESYESMANHLLRKRATELNIAQKLAFNNEQVDMAYEDLRDPAPVRADQCVTEVQLKGPFSPLESSLHSLMFAGGKQVHIEWNSVNSVLLYTEPQEIYERLLVAAAVGTNENSDKLTLRHTTLLPNIPGLPAIMALLFCPTTELRRDSTGMRYVSALCGLGSTADGAPLFPEHDLLINVDVDFTVADIININHIRFLMDFMMYSGPGQDKPSDDDEAGRAAVPRTIYEALMTLLTRPRSSQPPESVARAWEWKSAPADEMLELTDPELLERAVAYPMHQPLELRARTNDELRALKDEHDQLQATVKRMQATSAKEVECKLCGTVPMSILAMRTHLASKGHREKKELFRVFQV